MLIFNDFNTFLGQASEDLPDLLPRCEFVVSPALWSSQNFLSAVTIAGKKAGQRFEADSASNAQGLVPPALCLCCYDVESVRSPVQPGMTGRIRYQLFTRLFLLAEIDNFTAEEYKQYQKSLESMSDFDNIISSTEERGRAEGLAEGRAEGRTEVIKKMLDAGIPAATIAEALGITTDECLAYK